MHHTQGLEQGGGAKHRKQSAQCNDDDHCLRQKQGGVVGVRVLIFHSLAKRLWKNQQTQPVAVA